MDVLIVGAGLSGMSAYLEATRHPHLRVEMVDYEAHPGGELRFYPGFEDANEIRTVFMSAAQNDPNVHFLTTAVGVLAPFREGDPLEVSLSAADGTRTVKTKAVVLCTGMFDSSRENNRVPGQRPAGVYTPSFAVRALERNTLPGKNPVVHVESRRDVEVAKRLKNAGANIAAIIGQPDRIQKFAPDLSLLDARIIECSSVSHIDGRARVESVTVDTAHATISIPCDALIYASGRHSCTFAMKGSDVEINAETGGIQVDANGETSVRGVFAAGTCVDLHEDHLHSVERSRQVMAHVAHSVTVIEQSTRR